ncbi:helix-turn-helix domain-containing protein [Ralstonia pseudosolanacearum]
MVRRCAIKHRQSLPCLSTRESNQSLAAEYLGVGRPTLRSKLAETGKARD